MVRDSLSDLPELRPPAGYAIRTFQAGDEAQWEQIVASSFETPRSFQAVMREDPSFQPERMFFAVHNGRAVATAAAWYHPLWGGQYGYLHFVGVRPEYRGRRLGYWISLAALKRFQAEHRTMAALETESFMVPAIKTYLRLGFQPQLTADTLDAWHRLSDAYNLKLSFPLESWLTGLDERL